jgi:hypothetical protein
MNSSTTVVKQNIDSDEISRLWKQQSTLLCVSEAVGDFILLEVFSYMSSEELCLISTTCRKFCTLAVAPPLWKELNMRSFYIVPDEILSQPSLSIVDQVKNAVAHTMWSEPKLVPTVVDYQQIYRSAFTRMKLAGQSESRDASQFYEVHGQDEQLFRLGRLMDLLEIYIYVPLVAITILLFVVLMALKVDGAVKMSYWMVFGPLFLLFSYTLFCMGISSLVHSQRYNSASVFCGLGEHFSSPIHEIVKEAPRAGKVCAGVVVLLCIVGCCTLCLKLTGYPSGAFGWGLVFLPAWALLFLFCTTPCFGVIEDVGVFVLIGILGWVPAFTVFLCLTLRLDAQEQHTGGTDGKLHYENLRMAIMFIPFWIIEAVVMLGMLIFFCLAFYRHRLGYEDAYMVEAGGGFCISWCVLGLLVAFQIMLCLRVDGDGVDGNYNPEAYHHLSAMDIVSPLCVLLGWLLIAALVFLAIFETPFQV